LVHRFSAFDIASKMKDSQKITGRVLDIFGKNIFESKRYKDKTF
jgi:hypothetical protein